MDRTIRRTVNYFASFLILAMLAGCKLEWPLGNDNTNEAPARPAWAAVHLAKISDAIYRYLRQQNPELDRWIKNQTSVRKREQRRTTADQFEASDYERQASALLTKLVDKCVAKAKDMPASEEERQLQKLLAEGYASGTGGALKKPAWRAIHRQRCYREAMKDQRYARLVKKSEELRAREKRARQYQNAILDLAEQEAKEAVAAYAKGQFVVVLPTHVKPVYAEPAPQVDITQAVIDRFLQGKPKIAIPPLPSSQ